MSGAAYHSVERPFKEVAVNKIVLSVAALAAASLAFAGGAYATTYGTINATYTSVSPQAVVAIHANPGATSGSPGAWLSESVYAGVYNFRTNWVTWATPPNTPLPTGAPLAAGSTFGTHCIDTTNLIGTDTYVIKDVTDAPSPTTYSGGTTISAGRLVDLQKLLSRNSVGTSTDAAARQVAVWEVVFEHWNSYEVNAGGNQGSFYVTDDSAVATRADQMLADLGAWQYGEWVPDLYAFVAPGQDQLWLAQGDGHYYVPEPLTMLGMVFGLGSVGAYIRKRRGV